MTINQEPYPTVSENAILRKVTLRLIPFMFLMYIVNYLDRINVSFAAESMKADLHLTATVYGIGAGIFFVGYFIFEVPSNLILERVGARIWIARIMITWGIISSMMMLVRNPLSFYGLRFLLGVAEAGFFPGMILYLTYWFPALERAKAISRFMTATPLAGVIGAPVSTALLTYMPGLASRYLPLLAGLKGWQWLFLIEGIPSFLLGFVVLIYLTDKPGKAHWLTAEEKVWLLNRLEQEGELRQRQHRHLSLGQALSNGRVLLLAAVYFTMQIAFYGYSFWLPQIIKSFHGLSSTAANLMAAIPYLLAAICMVLAGMSSDRTGERRWHLALAAFIATIGMAASAYMKDPLPGMVALSLAAMGLWSTLGPFWSLPTSFLGGTAAAGGIAMINSIGNLGGYVGSLLMGKLKDSTGSYQIGLLCLALSILAAGLLALTVRISETTTAVEPAAVPGD